MSRRTVKVTADTNVLVRAITEDDVQQSRHAQAELAAAEQVVVTIPTLCELCWVLDRGYRIAPSEIASVVRRVIDSANVVTNRPAAEAGLALLEAGGDFSDGVIAFEGRQLGGEFFLSFDRKATRLIQAQGTAVRLLA